MTQLDSRGDLAAAEIGFYSISFLLSVFICVKQGSFARNAGWFYLVLISILRLIGSSCILYMETQNDYSASLQETTAITSSVGTAPLLLVLMGLLERVHAQMQEKNFSPNVFRPLHVVSIVTLVLAIVGGVLESENGDNYHTGKDCTEAASILFLVVYGALAMIAILTAFRMPYIPGTEKKLIIAGVCVLPFILVRVIYTVAVSFSNPGSVFYFRNVNVWIQVFMQFFMEAIIICFYIWAGLFTPKQVLGQSRYNAGSMNYGRNNGPGGDEENGYARQPQSKPQRRQKNIGDYRPSRLIRNAIRDRN